MTGRANCAADLYKFTGPPEPEHWERRYPPRGLPAGAEVTRFSPSPTGFLHIGGVYTATIDVGIARHSGGRYLVRVEDTDQARVVEGAAELRTSTRSTRSTCFSSGIIRVATATRLPYT